MNATTEFRSDALETAYMATMMKNKKEASETTDYENCPSELSAPTWSVVSYEDVAASGLSYEEAKELAGKLKSNRVSGICIITDKAAARVAF